MKILSFFFESSTSFGAEQFQHFFAAVHTFVNARKELRQIDRWRDREIDGEREG